MHECARPRWPGDVARRARSTIKLLPLHRKLFVEPNPDAGEMGAAAAWAACPDGLRLPMVPLSAPNQRGGAAALQESGLA